MQHTFQCKNCPSTEFRQLSTGLASESYITEWGDVGSQIIDLPTQVREGKWRCSDCGRMYHNQKEMENFFSNNL